MSESQIALNDHRKEQLGLLLEAMPETGKQIFAQLKQTYKDGALSARHKHLMALTLALGAGCRNCILFHSEAALEQGATKAEFLEAIEVVISMRGTTGVAESLRVIQFLQELGKL